MVKKKKDSSDFDIDSFTNDVIKGINTQLKDEIAFNLGDSEDPAKIKRWYSTGSKLLDGICSGTTFGGGLPAGRFVEISGVESIGKSHIAYQLARWVQQNGGITCYADTELASSVDNLRALGIDTSKRFVYSKPKSIEDVFNAAEAFLKICEEIPKSKKKDIPLAIVWDSVGGIGSKIEESMGFDDTQRPGLNAKQTTFGLRKIKNSINRHDATFVIVNQVYDVLNAGLYEKKTQTKGGKGIRYDSSIRIELQGRGYVYPDEMDRSQAIAKGLHPIGIKVKASTVKNKVAAPFRHVEFEIHFGVGIKEHMTIWDWLCKEEKGVPTSKGTFKVLANGAWKEIGLLDSNNDLIMNKKFRKKEIEDVFADPEWKDIIDEAIEVLVRKLMDPANKNAVDVQTAKDATMESIKDQMSEQKKAFADIMDGDDE